MKTEELASSLLEKPKKEKERLREIDKGSHNLFKLLKEKGLFYIIKGDKEEINSLKRLGIGAVYTSSSLDETGP